MKVLLKFNTGNKDLIAFHKQHFTKNKPNIMVRHPFILDACSVKLVCATYFEIGWASRTHGIFQKCVTIVAKNLRDITNLGG
jgi:hypothetical protein